MSEIVEQTGNLEISYQTKAEDMFWAALVVDKQNGTIRRRNIESFLLFGIFLWMGWPTIDGEYDPFNMAVCGIMLLGLFILWKLPPFLNRRFAYSKERKCPEVQMSFQQDGIQVQEGGESYFIPFEGSLQIYDFRNVIVISHGKNRVLAIPRNQMERKTLEQLVAFFKERLGERYTFIVDKVRYGNRVSWLQ
ncbi:MAG: YcxB family protein [Anaerotruncus sp.]|nr:YcxB family protein [Anaerotruncus sp.]